MKIPKFVKSPCSKCGSSIDKINPQWLRIVRKRAGLGLTEFGRIIGKYPAYMTNVELGRKECIEEIQAQYEALKKEKK